MIHCLLFQASLPASYWAEALHTATHLNCLPSKAMSHPTPHFVYDTAPRTTTFAFSVVPAILTLLPPLPISYLLAPLVASSWATPLTTRGIAALTSPHIASSSLIMSSSTKMCFPLLAPPHPSISTPYLSLIWLPLHPRRPALCRYLHHVRPRRLRSHLFLCHARPRRPCLCHVRPRRLLQRHVRPCRRARLASPTLPSSTAAVSVPLPWHPLTRTRRRARLALPNPSSSITAASRPCPRPPTSRSEPPVYHLVAIHRDPGHVHRMVTRRVVGVLRPIDRLILAADKSTTPPDTSPVPSSVRTALADPHWRRAMEEYVALLANHTCDLVP
jgi:hypothetical protein